MLINITVISPSTLYFPIFVPQGQSLWIILAISLSYPFIKKKKLDIICWLSPTEDESLHSFFLPTPCLSNTHFPSSNDHNGVISHFNMCIQHIYYCDCANNTHNWATQLILITFSLLYDFLVLNAVNIEKKKEKKMVAEKKSSSGVRKYSQI